MNEQNDIQIEERNVPSAITWGVICGLYFIIPVFVLRNRSSIISNPDTIIRNGILTTYGLVYLANWMIHIITAIFVIKIARRLKRSPVIWGLSGFIFPPITLIVIGFQDVKIEDKNVKKIVDALRLDFETELLHIKSTDDLSEKELNEVEMKLKEKFNQKIRDRIAEGRFNEEGETRNAEELEKREEQNIIETEEEEEEIVQSVTHKTWTSEISKCPACGASVTDNASVCQDCGLALN